MKPHKQQEGMERTERRELSLQHNRNAHSVPPSIHRSHSSPPRFGKSLMMTKMEHLIYHHFSLTWNFSLLYIAVRNKWGSEETRKSYICLCSLANNTECKRCVSSATLSELDRYSLGKTSNPKWKRLIYHPQQVLEASYISSSTWGNFLHLSSDIDATSATDDD